MNMSKGARMLAGCAGLLLLLLYLLPLWQIRLIAPQYPEGLGMRIRVNTVVGLTPTDLGNINGLNHYIGMKTIDPEAIPVLRAMPIVVGALAAGILLVALIGRRRLLTGWLAAFGVFAAVGLAEFWWWEYDYGHHLDLEHAIIKIPGMSYQPPLIGSKQLLNFTASSWPASGAYVAVIAFGVAYLAYTMTSRKTGTFTPAGTHG